MLFVYPCSETLLIPLFVNWQQCTAYSLSERSVFISSYRIVLLVLLLLASAQARDDFTVQRILVRSAIEIRTVRQGVVRWETIITEL